MSTGGEPAGSVSACLLLSPPFVGLYSSPREEVLYSLFFRWRFVPEVRWEEVPGWLLSLCNGFFLAWHEEEGARPQDLTSLFFLSFLPVRTGPRACMLGDESTTELRPWLDPISAFYSPQRTPQMWSIGARLSLPTLIFHYFFLILFKFYRPHLFPEKHLSMLLHRPPLDFRAWLLCDLNFLMGQASSMFEVYLEFCCSQGPSKKQMIPAFLWIRILQSHVLSGWQSVVLLGDSGGILG